MRLSKRVILTWRTLSDASNSMRELSMTTTTANISVPQGNVSWPFRSLECDHSFRMTSLSLNCTPGIGSPWQSLFHCLPFAWPRLEHCRIFRSPNPGSENQQMRYESRISSFVHHRRTYIILTNTNNYIYRLHLGHFHTPALCSPLLLTRVRIPPAIIPFGGYDFYTRLMTRCISDNGDADFTLCADLVPPPVTTGKHACWCHKVLMSLWLSGPAISLSEIQVFGLQGLPFVSNSATFIFFWTFFVTSVIILLLAVRATYCAPRANQNTPSLGSKLRLQRFGPAQWEDEEKANMMLKDGYVTIKI